MKFFKSVSWRDVQRLSTLAIHGEDPVWLLTPISHGAQLPATLAAGALTPSSGLHVHPH